MAGVGVGSWIERRARIDPDRPAIITGDRPVSYAELAERIRRLAGGLSRLGVVRGDRVAWLGPNHGAFLEALGDGAPHLGILAAAMDDQQGRSRSADLIRVDDLLFLPHTSGTTGSPKGVMLSHGNVTWNVVNFLSRADFRGDDVTIAIAPFFRVGGTGVNVLPVLFLGGTVVVPDDVTGDGLLGSIERNRVSVGFGNPDVLEELTRAGRWAAADLSGIRFILTGGAPVPERLIRVYHDRGIPLVQGYGLSEAGPLVLLMDAARSLLKVGSAGRPPLLVDVRIVDPDGNDVAPGETGELLTRGPNVMAGYWRRPADTAEALVAGGWLRTGDAARVDDEGDVWIVDRVDAGFVVGGRTVYPGGVERQLMTHPAVVDAGVAGFVGPDGDTVGAAFVVLLAGSSMTETALLEFARRRLAPHEVPFSITFLDRLPRSSVGKLLRADLRDLAGGRAVEED